MERIPDDFDVNGIQIVADFFGEDFEELPNELGGSDSDKAERQVIDAKINGKESFLTLKKLIGKMGHYFLKQRKCLIALVKSIYEQTGIAVKWVKVEAYKRKCLECGYEDNHKKEDDRPRLEVCPECGCKYWCRYHVDILTDQYAVEIKWSLMYVQDFKRMISEKYAKQTNFYMGGLGVNLAFVWYFNIAAFKNKFTSWDQVWNKYGYCIAMKFHKEQYDKTIERFKSIFKHVESKDLMVKCPSSEPWECKPKNCDFHDECPNPIEYIEVGPNEPYCSHCKHKIKQDPNTKKQTVPAFRRNGKIYCKSPECTKAVIDAWEYNINQEGKNECLKK